MEALALGYRQALGDLARVTGRRLRQLCIVVGGSLNTMLCRMAADATGLTVLAGPAEATAAGNIGAQALATGALKTPDDIRRLVRRSFPLRTHEPRRTSGRLWDRHFRRYEKVLEIPTG